jgi:hypothetical protein
MLDRGVHARQPSKAQMRKRLAKVANAATVLQRALEDVAIKEFLELEGAIRIQNDGGLDHTLRMIAERAALASNSPRISSSSTKAKRGRGKALPTNAISPKGFCAIIISETWKYLHGQYPGARNTKAAMAADAYWQATGGAASSWGTDPYSGWRQHFEEARSPAGEVLRQEIHRHCVEHFHLDQYLRQGGN